MHRVRTFLTRAEGDLLDGLKLKYGAGFDVWFDRQCRRVLLDIASGTTTLADIKAIPQSRDEERNFRLEQDTYDQVRRLQLKGPAFLRFVIHSTIRNPAKAELEEEYRQKIGAGDPGLMSEDFLYLLLRHHPNEHNQFESRVLRELRNTNARLEDLEARLASSWLTTNLAQEGAKIRYARRQPTREEIDTAPSWLLELFAGLAGISVDTDDLRNALKREWGLT